MDEEIEAPLDDLEAEGDAGDGDLGDALPNSNSYNPTRPTIGTSAT